jgi:hypothetical protein
MVTVLLTVVETVLEQLQRLQPLQHQPLLHQLQQHQLQQHQPLLHQLLQHQPLLHQLQQPQVVVLLMRYAERFTIAMDKADVAVLKDATDYKDITLLVLV